MDALRRKLDDLAARRRPAAASAVPRAAPPPVALAQLPGGRPEHTPNGLCCWRIETLVSAVCSSHNLSPPAALLRWHTALGRAGPLTLLPELGLVPPAEPAAGPSHDYKPANPAGVPLSALRRAIVLDVETGGFSGTEVFLVGCLALDSRPLRIVQWLARDYPEEAALIAALAHLRRERDTWVTFNGKSFDAPFLADRAALQRVPLPPPATHVDVLHAARRRWRAALPNCRLQTLEQHVLGWRRCGDVPGSDVPALYHHFIRTGNAAPLRPVLEHNRLDLIACAELLLRLCEGQC